MRKGRTLIAVASLAVAAPVVAQMDQHAQTAAACPATPAPLPAALASWTAAQPLAAATGAQGLPAATLTLGKAVDLGLKGTPDIAYVMRPARPGGSVSSGGMAQFAVAKAGRYRVAIDSAAWLDLVSAGKGLDSVDHGHGPDCSGIRKMVDFDLTPGIYQVQVVGNGSPKIRLLVTPLPAA